MSGLNGLGRLAQASGAQVKAKRALDGVVEQQSTPAGATGPIGSTSPDGAIVGAGPIWGPRAPGQLTRGNLDLTQRPTVYNRDGSYSTVRSLTVGDDDGVQTLIPTVVGDKVLPNRQAESHYEDTGENLGSFVDDPSAEAYAEWLHQSQEATYPSDPSRANLALNGLIAQELQRRGLG